MSKDIELDGFNLDDAVNEEIASSPDVSPDELNKMLDDDEPLEHEAEAVNKAVEKPYLDVTDEERETTDLVARALKDGNNEEVKEEILNTLILHVWAKFKAMGKGGWFYIGSLGLVAGLMYRKEIGHAWFAVYGFFKKKGELV